MTTVWMNKPQDRVSEFANPYMTKENKEIKNSVLLDLFCEHETARQNEIALYNALHDVKLPDDTVVDKVRVNNTVYLNFKNDISFGINGKVIVLCEHQSTINNNMPLRELLYIGRIFEQVVPIRDRYKRGLVKLPVPEFYTFYNGKTDMKKEKILKLSDAYLLQPDNPMLELTVKMININTEAGHPLLEKCEVMRQYSVFIDTIRKYQETGDTEAYKHAIEECIGKDILAEYLQKNGSEVINMLQAEYDYEMDIEVQREEAAEEAAIKTGKKEKRHAIQEALAVKGDVSADLLEKINKEDDIHILAQWFTMALKTDTIDNFARQIL